MQEKIEVNIILIKWLTDVIVDLVVNRIEDAPDKVPILFDTNNLLNKIDDVTYDNIATFLGEELVNKIFAEIKDSI